jgi:hypothetical protein
MGDPPSQLALYCSAVNAGGRYTTAIGMAHLLSRTGAYTGDVDKANVRGVFSP